MIRNLKLIEGSNLFQFSACCSEVGVIQQIDWGCIYCWSKTQFRKKSRGYSQEMITWLTSHYINYSQASGLKSLPNISLYIFISFSLLFFNSRSHFCNHRGTSLLAPFDNSATYSTLNKCLKLNALLPFQSFPWLCHSLPTECKPGHVWKSLSMKSSHYKAFIV